MSGARLALVLLVAAVIALGILGMHRGSRRRAARQDWVPAPPALPDDVGAVRFGPVTGMYVASTLAGDWLDRVAVHGLGHRGRAVLTVTDRGVRIERTGEPTVWIPVADLTGVRLDRGLAQQVYEAGGVLVLTWRLGAADEAAAAPQGARECLLDTGFRADSTADHLAAAAAADQLLAV